MPTIDWRETANGVERPNWLGVIEGPYRLKVDDEDTGFLMVVGSGMLGDTSDLLIYRDEKLQGIVADTARNQWVAIARGRMETTESRDEAVAFVIDLVRQSGGAI